MDDPAAQSELRVALDAAIGDHRPARRGRLVRLADFMAGATLSHAPASKGSAVTAGSESGLKAWGMVTTIAIGQAPQALVYVPNAVPAGDGTQNLQPLGQAGAAAHLTLANHNGESVFERASPRSCKPR